jgi:hypothetical protein
VSVKRRWKIALLVVAVVAIVIAIVTVGDSEPRYNGRTLSEWITAYQDAYAASVADPSQTQKKAQASEAAQALRAMTPDILPILVKWVSYEKSEHVARLENFFIPIANAIGLGNSYFHLTQKGENRTYVALAVFDVLGTNAIPVIPQLSNMVMRARSPDDPAAVAATALTSIGKPGAQTLAALINNSDARIRPFILAMLLYCTNNAADVVAAEVSQQLTNSDPNMRLVATNIMKHLR